MNKKFFIISWIVLVLLGLITTAVTAAPIDNLSVSDYGSNFITWSWSFNESNTAAVYIDGIKKVNETALDYFTLSNLNPCESHTITLSNPLNASDIYATNTAQTFYPFSLFITIFIFLMIFLILMLILREETTTMIFGTLTFITGMFAYKISYPYHYTAISYICLAIAVFSVIWLLMLAISLATRLSSFDKI